MISLEKKKQYSNKLNEKINIKNKQKKVSLFWRRQIFFLFSRRWRWQYRRWLSGFRWKTKQVRDLRAILAKKRTSGDFIWNDLGGISKKSLCWVREEIMPFSWETALVVLVVRNRESSRKYFDKWFYNQSRRWQKHNWFRVYKSPRKDLRICLNKHARQIKNSFKLKTPTFLTFFSKKWDTWSQVNMKKCLIQTENKNFYICKNEVRRNLFKKWGFRICWLGWVRRGRGMGWRQNKFRHFLWLGFQFGYIWRSLKSTRLVRLMNRMGKKGWIRSIRHRALMINNFSRHPAVRSWWVEQKKYYFKLNKHCHFWKKLFLRRGFAIYYRDRQWKLKPEKKVIRWDPRLQKKVIEFIPRVEPYRRGDFYYFSVKKINKKPGVGTYHFQFRFYRSWSCRKLMAYYYQKRLASDLEINYKIRWVVLSKLLTDAISHKKIPSFLNYAIIGRR